MPANEREALASGLLSEHPDAWVTAVANTGLIIPMPPSLDIGDHPVIEGHTTALGLVESSDLIRIVRAFEDADHTGASSTQVALRGAAGSGPSLVHFVDLTERYGVFLGVFSDVSAPIAAPDSASLRPRLSVMRRDRHACPIEIDEAAVQLLGWPEDQLLHRSPLDHIHPDDQERAYATWLEMAAIPDATRRTRYRYQRQDGAWVWLEVTNHNRLDDPTHGDVLSEVVNISEEMAAHEALRANERLLHQITEALPVAIAKIDVDRNMVFVNSRFTMMFDSPAGQAVSRRLASVIEADRPVLEKAIDRALVRGRDSAVEVSFRTREHRIRRGAISVDCLTSEEGIITGAVLCITDITRETRLRKRLEQRATVDSLTRCHNRASTLAELERLVAAGAGTGMAVLFVDVNKFKEINDAYGHAIGDDLLHQIGQRLLASARKQDLVGRIGGDEFLVVCTDVHSPSAAEHIASRITSRISTPVTRGDITVIPEASIGIAWTRDGSIDADQLISVADTAMYEAKHSSAPALRVLP